MPFPRHLLQGLDFLHLQSTIAVIVAVAGVMVFVPTRLCRDIFSVGKYAVTLR